MIWIPYQSNHCNQACCRVAILFWWVIWSWGFWIMGMQMEWLNWDSVHNTAIQIKSDWSCIRSIQPRPMRDAGNAIPNNNPILLRMVHLHCSISLIWMHWRMGWLRQCLTADHKVRIFSKCRLGMYLTYVCWMSIWRISLQPMPTWWFVLKMPTIGQYNTMYSTISSTLIPPWFSM